MHDVDVLGVGAWSAKFADWNVLVEGLRSGSWQEDAPLHPVCIPPRDRRRTPKSVKMAVEVMHQACEMAAFTSCDAAVVFASAMGDMDITDYMCSTLASAPKQVSPTRFHNSVHNAPAGYWSIATRSHAAANAVSAYLYTAPVALLEAAIQCVVENTPVLLATQEVAAPPTLRETCRSGVDFATALLLAPRGRYDCPVTTVSFEVESRIDDWPLLPETLQDEFDGNPAAKLLPLLAAIAGTRDGETRRLTFPLSDHSVLELSLSGRRCA